MKNILLVLFTCSCLQIAKAQATWQGGWETQHGHVEIIVSKGYVYGLYANVGWLYGKIAPGNKRVVGTFWNEDKKNSGRFEWTLNNAGTAFTGKWAWGENYKTLQQLDGGDWNGTKSTSKSSSKPWTKTFTTNAGELQVIHLGGNRALGLIDEVVLCGKVLNNNTLTGVMKTIDVIGIGKQYGTSFSLTQTQNQLSGHWFKPSGKQNITGTVKGSTPQTTTTRTATLSAQSAPTSGYTIRVTYNTLKLNKARMGKTQTVDYDLETFPSDVSRIGFKRFPASVFEYNYSDLKRPAFFLKGEEFREGVEKKLNNTYIDFKFDMPLSEITSKGIYVSNKISMKFKISGMLGKVSSLTRNTNIVEVLQYLTKEVNASDFPDAVHGRKRLSNSSDTFWLEEIAGKRKVRGYGDLIFDNDVRFGYSYTIELID